MCKEKYRNIAEQNERRGNRYMKKTLFTFLAAAFSLSLAAQEKFGLSHGPYLQEVTTDKATVVFQTSGKAFSWVEVKPHGAPEEECVRYYASDHGLKMAYNTFNSIRLKRLEPAKAYDYRILSKEMRSFQPYKVVFGDSIATPWHTFSTIDPEGKGASIFITSDMHGDAAKLDTLLHWADYKTCHAFFYAGDMMNYMDRPELPFTSFIDISVKRFASSIPFEVVRGNHETRGNLAREFSRYFPKEDGKIYGAYRLGDIMVVMLDSGEDKADSHPVYAGLTDFDAYRTEQAAWLEELVQTKEYKTARYRIVISHFPMVMPSDNRKEGVWKGWEDAIRKFLPVLNKAGVDLLVSGHTHRYAYYEAGADGNNFPVLIQGAYSAARLDVKDGKIQMKVLDTAGQVLKEAVLDTDKR